MAVPRYNSPSLFEKLVASASYIFPLVGFVFVIITALLKKDMKAFLKYHIFQSIFIAFTLWIVVSGLGFLMKFVSYIPGVKNVVGIITFFLNTPLFYGFSIITFLYFLFVIYLIIGVLRGSDSYVPWISDVIKTNLRGQI
ncbi:MAG: hypothetical protein V8R83_00345 [Candidatus Gastranaerophilaceae bacterium]|uniref:DUF4870 domain-containing protein n=1 Tax=Candidatus Limenecus avicola TaxID=2840847 RepID=A0A9D1SR79_9CLOT|nr:hypothetical protein [Clostridium sp.]CDC19091.1 unknown [Clostridium sp. CAG:306]DAB20468.1 MAG TPA: hypothetical protein CPT85_09945 [Candidatus Gastranaerophilales bacterium HUM_21]HIU91841.1 hypothetical protein [Candidatus Limenecus avicola]